MKDIALLAATLAAAADPLGLFAPGSGYQPPRHKQTEEEKQALLKQAEEKRARRAEKNKPKTPT